MRSVEKVRAPEVFLIASETLLKMSVGVGVEELAAREFGHRRGGILAEMALQTLVQRLKVFAGLRDAVAPKLLAARVGLDNHEAEEGHSRLPGPTGARLGCCSAVPSVSLHRIIESAYL